MYNENFIVLPILDHPMLCFRFLTPCGCDENTESATPISGSACLHACLQGLIQSVYELSDRSGMVLTVGKYVTPAHVDIDTNGIEPDFRRLPGGRNAETNRVWHR